MPRERNRKKLLEFCIEVTEYVTKEKGAGDTADKFTAKIKSIEKPEFKIGLRPAEATMSITAQDDSIKAILVNGNKYRIAITEYFESESQPKAESAPTTLDQHQLSEEKSTEEANQTETVQAAPQAICPSCNLPVALCACASGDSAIAETATIPPEEVESALEQAEEATEEET